MKRTTILGGLLAIVTPAYAGVINNTLNVLDENNNVIYTDQKSVEHDSVEGELNINTKVHGSKASSPLSEPDFSNANQARSPAKPQSKGFISVSPMFQDNSLETTVVDAYGTPLKKSTTSHKQGVAIDSRVYVPVSERLAFEFGANGYKVADKDAMDFLNGEIDLRIVGNYGKFSAGIGPTLGVNQGNMKTRTGSVTLSKQQAGLVGDVNLTFADIVRLGLEGKTYTGSKLLPDADSVKGNAIDFTAGLQLGDLLAELNAGYQTKEDGIKVISEKHVGGKVIYKLFKGLNFVGAYEASFPHSGGNATERQDTYQVGLQFGNQRTR